MFCSGGGGGGGERWEGCFFFVSCFSGEGGGGRGGGRGEGGGREGGGREGGGGEGGGRRERGRGCGWVSEFVEWLFSLSFFDARESYFFVFSLYGF